MMRWTTLLCPPQFFESCTSLSVTLLEKTRSSAKNVAPLLRQSRLRQAVQAFCHHCQDCFAYLRAFVLELHHVSKLVAVACGVTAACTS